MCAEFPLTQKLAAAEICVFQIMPKKEKATNKNVWLPFMLCTKKVLPN